MGKKKRIATITAAAAAAALVLGAFFIATAAGPGAVPAPAPPGPPPQPTPTPLGYTPPQPPPMTVEEELRSRAEAEKRAGGIRIPLAGPETAGTRIFIRDRYIQLPPDAMLGGLMGRVLCVEGRPCLDSEMPAYTILRGQSMIGVSIRSGAILTERVAAGEEGAFDFLKEALR